MAMPPIKRALIQMNIIAFLWGGTGIFAKLITLPAIPLIAIRAWFALATVLVIKTVLKQPFYKLTPKSAVHFIIIGALMAIHWTTFIHAMKVSSVAVGMIAFFTFPMITVLMQPLFYKQKIDLPDIIGTICIIIGMVIISPDLDIHNSQTQGVIFGLLSAVAFSLRNLLNQRWASHVPTMSNITYQILVAGVLLFPFVDFGASISTTDWILLGVFGIFLTGINHAVFVDALKYLKASTAGIIISTEPVYAMLLSYPFLGEIPTPRTLIGGAIILSITIWENLRHAKDAINIDKQAQD